MLLARMLDSDFLLNKIHGLSKVIDLHCRSQLLRSQLVRSLEHGRGKEGTSMSP